MVNNDFVLIFLQKWTTTCPTSRTRTHPSSFPSRVRSSAAPRAQRSANRPCRGMVVGIDFLHRAARSARRPSTRSTRRTGRRRRRRRRTSRTRVRTLRCPTTTTTANDPYRFPKSRSYLTRTRTGRIRTRASPRRTIRRVRPRHRRFQSRCLSSRRRPSSRLLRRRKQRLYNNINRKNRGSHRSTTRHHSACFLYQVSPVARRLARPRQARQVRSRADLITH